MVTPQECMRLAPKPPEEFIKEIDEFLLTKFRGKPKQFIFPFGTPKDIVITLARAYYEASWCVYIGKEANCYLLLFAYQPIEERWAKEDGRLKKYDPNMYSCQL